MNIKELAEKVLNASVKRKALEGSAHILSLDNDESHRLATALLALHADAERLAKALKDSDEGGFYNGYQGFKEQVVLAALDQHREAMDSL